MGESKAPHWDKVYTDKASDRVSWYRPHLDTSLRLLAEHGLDADSAVIDVGGGASTLVDDLLARGLRKLTVLDLSAQAIDLARKRLGPGGAGVNWLVGDVTRLVLPQAAYDYWHDRAVLHFLGDAAQVQAYARTARRAVRPGGFAIIGGFAPEGPTQCSGLPVTRRSANDIATLLGPAFVLVAQTHEEHRTPAGGVQAFVYAVLRRVADE